VNESQKYVNRCTCRGMGSAEILLPGSSFVSWGWCSSKAILGLRIALLPFPQKAEQIAIELDNSELELSQSVSSIIGRAKGGSKASVVSIYRANKW